MITKKINV